MLPTLTLDIRTAWVITGLIYLVMPLAVWSVLHGRHTRRNVALWCGGAAISGVSILIFGVRDLIAPVPLIFIGNGLNYLGFTMRWAALRAERRRDLPAAWALGLPLVLLAALALAHLQGDAVRLVVNTVATGLLALLIVHEAVGLAREHASRSAALVAVSYALLVLAVGARGVAVAAAASDPHVLWPGIDVFVLIAGGLIASLWGTVGYLGFALETANRRAKVRGVELAAATARGEQAERQAAELKALSDERQELLRVISHEVRQPLHNAQAVLQGVDRALRGEAGGGEAAAARIARARMVLAQITGGLDNILAASTLLVGDRPTALRDTDIDMAVQLSLGDLPPAGRARVRVVQDTSVRTAAMDVGLMRLALRNLLNNALAYARPDSEIVVRVSESDEPLAVIFEVADNGPGIAPELIPHLFERGTRGRHDLPGQGLGLYIVQLALRRQGGSVAVLSNAHGTVFTLTVPQGQEPA